MLPEQTRVSRAVWPWRQDPTYLKTLLRRAARRKALVHGAVLAGLAAASTMLIAHRPLGTALAAAGGFVLVLGLVFPGAYHFAHLMGLGLGRFVGRVLAWILLAPFYLTVFVAGRLILAARRRDPLQREFGGGAESYWIERAPSSKSPRSYERQY